MQHGCNLADSLDVETFMEASSLGKPLYERYGFQSLLKFGFDTEKPDASDTWRKCEHEMTPEPIFAMWRSKGGLWIKDGVHADSPWELGED